MSEIVESSIIITTTLTYRTAIAPGAQSLSTDEPTPHPLRELELDIEVEHRGRLHMNPAAVAAIVGAVRTAVSGVLGLEVADGQSLHDDFNLPPIIRQN